MLGLRMLGKTMAGMRPLRHSGSNLIRLHDALVNRVINPRTLTTSTTAPPASSSEESTSSAVELEYSKEIAFIKEKHAFNDANKQRLTGLVVSDKCSKSVTVQVQHYKYVSKYNASVQVRKKIMAHDEEELASLGDIVTIVPCRPMSRKKRHKLLTIVRKHKNIDFSQVKSSEAK